MNKLEKLPANLPKPVDDGKCNHLLGMEIPTIKLWATDGKQVELANFKENLVIYCYPMTGRPDTELPNGWEEIPGARGCTPQACSFRDHYSELKTLQFEVFGISTQSSEYQKEVSERLHLPYVLLSDDNLKFVSALKLPTFQVGQMELIKRLTLIFKKGKVVKYFYPVFPPDENINQVIRWINNND
ncbi:peroxiredoxin [Aequorivita sp. Q41]|uniref:peroxiredoxin n=1 Tax=Aequorivita sp. Q41 TaxID=3153300 RepID=UPI003242BD29